LRKVAISCDFVNEHLIFCRRNRRYNGQGVESLSPDNEVFLKLAHVYADNHPVMKKGDLCGDMFKEGITNGAHWYNVRGGMQDFNYVHSNCFEITMELSCCKYPLATTLLDEWGKNNESLYRYVEAAHMGIKGIVKDSSGNPVEAAEIIVEGIEHPIRTTSRGEYWRLLTPGKYRIGVKAQTYLPTDLVEIMVARDFTPPPVVAPILDFVLKRSSNSTTSTSSQVTTGNFHAVYVFFCFLVSSAIYTK